ALKQWIRKRILFDVEETLKILNRKLTGHCNYYSINGNLRSIRKYYGYARKRMYWMLNRRSQKKSVTWEMIDMLWKQYITPPKIKVNIWQSV
ncbi:MAG: hypothetical protein IKE94_00735, partial [Aeriscardovia sp.]|nr:hypothetical protein [Aeriscardovia sp.]